MTDNDANYWLNRVRSEDEAHPDLAMQVRCVQCLREQYALNVIAVSVGDGGCAWCRQKSRPMTQPEYEQALTARRNAPPGGHPPP